MCVRMKKAVDIDELAKNKDPGPGHYDLGEKKKKAKGTPFGIKDDFNSFVGRDYKVPGPGEYTMSTSAKTNGKVQVWEFGVRRTEVLRPSTAREIGPGAYNPEDSILYTKRSKSAVKNKGFGTAARNKLEREVKDPGPG
jgi:hypothetical protein